VQILDLGEIRYGVKTTEQRLRNHNDGAVKGKIAFVDVVGSGLPCPPWLSLTPPKGDLAAGEVLDASVAALNWSCSAFGQVAMPILVRSLVQESCAYVLLERTILLCLFGCSYYMKQLDLFLMHY
jgi:hypothetical protein